MLSPSYTFSTAAPAWGWPPRVPAPRPPAQMPSPPPQPQHPPEPASPQLGASEGRRPAVFLDTPGMPGVTRRLPATMPPQDLHTEPVVHRAGDAEPTGPCSHCHCPFWLRSALGSPARPSSYSVCIVTVTPIPCSVSCSLLAVEGLGTWSLGIRSPGFSRGRQFSHSHPTGLRGREAFRWRGLMPRGTQTSQCRPPLLPGWGWRLSASQ